jgi:hypothetical protein
LTERLFQKSRDHNCLAEEIVMKTSFQVVMPLVVVSVMAARTAGATLGEETTSEARVAAGRESAESTAAEVAEGRDNGPQKSSARTGVPKENVEIPEEMQACAANLRKMYAAIEKYKKDRGKLPDWLSDLVPDYLDKEVLLCPSSQRQKTSIWADPELPCSFTYEFSPARLTGNWGPATGMTCRDWKTRQVSFLGDVVPLVRCKHGSRVLSLSVGGQVYWSSVVWESLFVPDYRRGRALPPDDRPSDYTVPTGGADQLLRFIADLEEFRPRTPYQTAEHSRRAPAALQAAATRILRLEKDEWSEAYQTALRVLLGIRIIDILNADHRRQGQTVEFVKMFLKAKLEKRLESLDVELAMSAARALETSHNLELAADAYSQFAGLIAESGNAEFSETVKHMKDAAKRLSDAELVSLPNGWVIHKPVNLGPTVNSSSDDAGPALARDGLMLLFHSDRPGGRGQTDLWMCKRASLSEPFGQPVNLGPTVNSNFHDMDAALSTDGLTLLFESDRPGGHGQRDLWMCKRASSSEPFGQPVNLGPTVNSNFHDGQPALSQDGLMLLFSSHRTGGHGKSDLWMCTRASLNQSFGKPVNLGSTVNSSNPDYGPALSADGLTLLFHSYPRVRRIGKRAADLWMCTRPSLSEQFGRPVNLGPTINNGNFGDWQPALSADGHTLIFCSDRPGGQGDADLWMARIEQRGVLAVPEPPAEEAKHAIIEPSREEEGPHLPSDTAKPGAPGRRPPQAGLSYGRQE